jgi:hypothetical protein
MKAKGILEETGSLCRLETIREKMKDFCLHSKGLGEMGLTVLISFLLGYPCRPFSEPTGLGI